MKICVLQPSYENSDVDYKEFDPPRDLSQLIPDAFFHNAFLKKSSVYKQLKDLKRENFDIYVNLCQGYLDWDIPSIDVIYSLENLNLPYTGSTMQLYDPSKELMKYVSFSGGVSSPNFVLASKTSDLEIAIKQLTFPFFIKPSHAGDSLGIDSNSKVHSKDELFEQSIKLFKDFDSLLIEEYIEGREFSVFVIANPDDAFSPIVLHPIEFVFPNGELFKTYKLKTTEYHPNSNILCQDDTLTKNLKEAAKQIFIEFDGLGYARMDFRVNSRNEIFFLEINFACSVFYSEGFYGTADYILMKDGYGHSAFLKQIIHEGLVRFQRKQKKYVMRKNGLNGYGIFAKDKIFQGEIIFEGEMKSQRIVTKKFVDENWKNPKQMQNFKRYAYPIGKNYFILWDENPANWAPQNHSCNPNTSFDGLNVIAMDDIEKDAELTLDYSTFCSEDMEPFECHCGEKNCKKLIYGSIQTN